MKEDEYTIKSGMLDVGDGHKIYYQQWGNKKAKPIFFLHGGPGSGTKDKHKLWFDPEKQHVIFHDQRGCGNSTPFGKLDNNTTQNLISDMELIREKLGFEKIRIFGGSWGSCLALAYSIAHPTKVEKMLLNGIYTGTKRENDYIQQGGLSTHFPESWEQYFEVVPDDEKDDTVNYYLKKMQDNDKSVADDYIKRWNINESSAASVDPDLDQVKFSNREVEDKNRSVALIEAYYFSNSNFLDDNHIINNAKKLSEIPIILVQGRHDHVCPPETAYKLAKKIGANCHLHITPGSHMKEGAMREVIKAYNWSFLT